MESLMTKRVIRIKELQKPNLGTLIA
jgi:hypothetical protein